MNEPYEPVERAMAIPNQPGVVGEAIYGAMPAPTKEVGQRQMPVPFWLARLVPAWGTPEWLMAAQWRRLVRNQPVAQACRDTLIMNLLGLKWHIVARDPNRTVELRDEIDYNSDLIRNIDDDGYDVFTDLVAQDFLDIPFGGAAEVGRQGDVPLGKVMWAKRIDGATLFPTFNKDLPVGQLLQEWPTLPPVYFPRHAISRMISSPRPELLRKGWGMAPPERVYLAIELLFRGDRYYANLLLDTPEAGILDLGSIDKETATEWRDQWKELLKGPDPFKVPILWGAEPGSQPAKYISFTRPPQELMFDKAVDRYGSLIAAGYGMSLSDIGSAALGVDTLAGMIRQERHTRRTGMGILIVKITNFYNRILPPYLEFELIDRDEELMVSRGRARLASAMAMERLVVAQIITPAVGVAQLVADGLLTVRTDTLTDDAMSEDERVTPADDTGTGNINPNPNQSGSGTSLNSPAKFAQDHLQPNVPASQGGMGEGRSVANLVRKSTQDTIALCVMPQFRRLSSIAKRVLATTLESYADLEEESLATACANADSWIFDNHRDSLSATTGKLMQEAYTQLVDELKMVLWWKPELGKAELSEMAFEQMSEQRDALQTELKRRAFEYALPEPLQLKTIYRATDGDMFADRAIANVGDMLQRMLVGLVLSNIVHFCGKIDVAAESSQSGYVGLLNSLPEMAEELLGEWFVTAVATKEIE